MSQLPLHLRTFLFLLPLAVMLLGQRLLQLDDNLLAAPRPGWRDGSVYNLAMVFVFWVGIVGFFVHSLKHANKSRGWLALKLGVLVGVFASIAYLTG
jgi:hypothetical protein